MSDRFVWLLWDLDLDNPVWTKPVALRSKSAAKALKTRTLNDDRYWSRHGYPKANPDRYEVRKFKLVRVEDET